MAAACLWGCSGGDNSHAPAVPRAKAFPRPYDYGRSYRTVDSLPLHLEANTNATVRLTPQGADIIYPRYRATIHVSSLTLPSTDAVSASPSTLVRHAPKNSPCPTTEQWK